MFVSVVYFHPEYEGYSGKAYTYQTALPLTVGAKVIAPTAKNPDQRALVTMVDVDKPPFECREIVRMDVEKAEPQPSTAGAGREGGAAERIELSPFGESEHVTLATTL